MYFITEKQKQKFSIKYTQGSDESTEASQHTQVVTTDGDEAN